MKIHSIKYRLIYLILLSWMLSPGLNAQKPETSDILNLGEVRKVKVYPIDGETKQGYIVNLTDSTISLLDITVQTKGFFAQNMKLVMDSSDFHLSQIDRLKLLPSIKQRNQRILGSSLVTTAASFYALSGYYGVLSGSLESAGSSYMAINPWVIIGGLIVTNWIVKTFQTKRFDIDGNLDNFQKTKIILEPYIVTNIPEIPNR